MYKALTKFKSAGKGFIYNLKQAVRNGKVQWNPEDLGSPQMENDITIHIEKSRDSSMSDMELTNLEEAVIMLLNMRYNMLLIDDVRMIRSLASHDEPSYVQTHQMLNILKQLL